MCGFEHSASQHPPPPPPISASRGTAAPGEERREQCSRGIGLSVSAVSTSSTVGVTADTGARLFRGRGAISPRQDRLLVKGTTCALGQTWKAEPEPQLSPGLERRGDGQHCVPWPALCLFTLRKEQKHCFLPTKVTYLTTKFTDPQWGPP